METQMNVEIFWLLGLLAIGGCSFLLGRSVRINDTRDTGMVRCVVGWGIVLELIWVFVGVVWFVSKMGP